MTNKFTDATQANSFFKDINFTSIVDTIKNIYMSDGSMNTLLDFERVLDDADIYAFRNWINGELVQGPVIGRYNCSCCFMWPYKLMPDPKAVLRLTAIGCDVKMMKGQLEVPIAVTSKMKENQVWFMQITIPFDLMDDIKEGTVDLADQTIDLSEIEDAYDVDLDEETSAEIGDVEELSAAPDEVDPMGAPTL